MGGTQGDLVPPLQGSSAWDLVFLLDSLGDVPCIPGRPWKQGINARKRPTGRVRGQTLGKSWGLAPAQPTT